MSNTYPEHEKLKEVRDKSQAIHEFLEWLQQSEYKMFLAHYFRNERGRTSDLIVPNTKAITDLVAEFLEIDLVKLENEKREMLEEFRKVTESTKQQAP
jgi:hypothetical protein